MANNFIDIPENFCCPITGDLMQDPVLASDGHSYERSSIIAWLQRNKISPLLGLVLENTSLVDNHKLKTIINSFKEKMPESQRANLNKRDLSEAIANFEKKAMQRDDEIKWVKAGKIDKASRIYEEHAQFKANFENFLKNFYELQKQIQQYERFINSSVSEKHCSNKWQFIMNSKYYKIITLFTEFNSAVKRNESINLASKTIFTYLCQAKENEKISLIKNFCINKEIVLDHAQINLILAQNILDNLRSSKELESLKESYLNKISLKSQWKLCSSIIDLLTEELKETLYDIVLLSKTTNLVGLAASNAFTLLNKSGFSFTNKDLSRISIPYADLSYSMLINTNFESSNLHEVDLSMAQIYDSNFKNCDMAKADFGEEIFMCGITGKVAFSLCGGFLAITYNETIILYDAKTYQEIAQLVGHTSHINSLLFSDNGNYLMTASNNQAILWDTSSRLQIEQFPIYISYYSFSPCNNYLCLVPDSWSEIIRIYNINTKEIVHEIKDIFSSISFAHFSYSGNNLIILDGRECDFLNSWNISKETITYNIYCEKYSQVAISLNRKYLAYHTYQNNISIYTTETLEEIGTFKASTNSSLTFSPCGRYLASTSIEKGIIIFNLELQRIIIEISDNKNWLIESLIFPPKQKRFFVKTADKKLLSLKIIENAAANKKWLPRKAIKAASFSNDNKYFAVATEEGRIFIFLTENQTLFQQFGAHREGISLIFWSGIVLHSVNVCWNLIKIWNIYDLSVLRIIKTNSNSQWIEFSPDGKKFLSCEKMNSVTIWDIDTNKIISQWSPHSSLSSICHWSLCGNFLLSCSSDKTLRIWSASNQELLIELNNFNDDCNAHLISTSYCGSFLMHRDRAKSIKIWNLEDVSEELKLVKELHVENLITSIMLPIDGYSIIAADAKGIIKVWNYHTAQMIRSIIAHKEIVTCFDLSIDKHFLVSASKDKVVKLWKYG